MGFISERLRKNRNGRDSVEHKAKLIEFLTARMMISQERLDTEEFEDPDEAVHLTQHVQRIRRIIDELEKANMQGPGQTLSAM